MKKFDIIIIVVVIVTSLIGAGAYTLAHRGKYDKKYAEVYVQGKLYETVPLDSKTDKKTFTVKTDLGSNLVSVGDGGVKIIDADCPDKVCIKDGFKDKPGETLVCLPNKVIVEIKGEKEQQVDELSY
jgi:hypothetical protein